MNKHERIEEYIRSQSRDGANPPGYDLFFSLFNAAEYYEAHDVLEHLWLQTRDPSSLFYKGLIQIAGAFVHLQKQFLRPEHPKDGKRLRPAARLLILGASNLRHYGPTHMSLNVEELCQLCHNLVENIQSSGFQTNPWSPHDRPLIRLSQAD